MTGTFVETDTLTMDEQELFRVRPIRLAVIRALQEIGAQWRRDRITEQYLAAAR